MGEKYPNEASMMGGFLFFRYLQEEGSDLLDFRAAGNKWPIATEGLSEPTRLNQVGIFPHCWIKVGLSSLSSRTAQTGYYLAGARDRMNQHHDDIFIP
jgi:hypothetical protein